MSYLNAALDLAKKGFHVFPVEEGGKVPIVRDFPNVAARDPDAIRCMWVDPLTGWEQPYNVGISTTRFSDQGALIVVDVDTKKNGFESLLELEMQGRDLPPTWTQTTPTGGKHLLYFVDEPLKQGTDVLGRGLDIRSRGGYIVGAGSTTSEGHYEFDATHSLARAPEWVVLVCGRASERREKATRAKLPEGVDPERARKRAIHYLAHEAPAAIEGRGGDETTYKVACEVKDFGLTEDETLHVMAEHWNTRCEPPWTLDELEVKIKNAYTYAQDGIGKEAAEEVFDVIDSDDFKDSPGEHPFDQLNRNYAFCLAGGGSHILWETKDSDGSDKLEHLGLPAFHQKFAAWTMRIGDRNVKPVTELWMKSERRRSYDGICFMPGRDTPERFYNLWRGFRVKPVIHPKTIHEKALNRFLEHSFENVCDRNERLHQWLMGYFAHMIQRPWEKPLTALVFRGRKGVGKNALIDRIGYLLGSHYLVSSKNRYLVGNFNGHLENLLMFALDEAFWSGDKQAEGTLKDLITGRTHLIEHKGREPYTVANCTRVVIIGNEDWLVPASQDERRFAVFDVGEGKKQNRKYFKEMREWMEDEGAAGYLLHYLQSFDLSQVDVDQAPVTCGLLDQKINSLNPIHQWWLECLKDERIPGLDFEDNWPQAVDKDRLRGAYCQYVKARQIRSWLPNDQIFTRALKQCCASIQIKRQRDEKDENRRNRSYIIPDIFIARADWDSFIGHETDWNK